MGNFKKNVFVQKALPPRRIVRNSIDALRFLAN